MGIFSSTVKVEVSGWIFRSLTDSDGELDFWGFKDQIAREQEYLMNYRGSDSVERRGHLSEMQTVANRIQNVFDKGKKVRIVTNNY